MLCSLEAACCLEGTRCAAAPQVQAPWCPPPGVSRPCDTCNNVMSSSTTLQMLEYKIKAWNSKKKKKKQCELKTTRQKWKHFQEMFVRTLHYHQLTQNKGKESENSYRKLKSWWWTGTRTHTWKQNQNISTTWPSISIRRERMYVITRRGLLSSEWEGQPCHWNILILFPCMCSCACPPLTLQFSVRVLTFLSLILCYSYFGTFLSTWSIYIQVSDVLCYEQIPMKHLLKIELVINIMFGH